MVRTAVWAKEGMRGYICIGYLEKRLGRLLTPRDFTAVPINDLDDPWKSERLVARIRGRSRMQTCDCCKQEVHAVDGRGLCFACEAVQRFASMIEDATDLDSNSSVDLAADLVEHLQSRILERLLDAGAPVKEFVADVRVGLTRQSPEH
jgi:hypothetical protein